MPALTDTECDVLIAEANQEWLRDCASRTQTHWQHYMIRVAYRAGLLRASGICVEHEFAETSEIVRAIRAEARFK